MRKVDRMLLCALVIGVWALVLKPEATTAHDDNDHSCSGRGTGYGELDGRDVYVHRLSLVITCEHG